MYGSFLASTKKLFVSNTAKALIISSLFAFLAKASVQPSHSVPRLLSLRVSGSPQNGDSYLRSSEFKM